MEFPVARLYDLLNAVLFAPSGGSGRLRQRLVDALALAPGDRVLELGCGTGQVTERLLAAGARVVAVDALPEMLAGARRRAPAAEYVVGDVFDADLAGPYDAVVISFVLHNLAADRRRGLLARATGLLAPGGTVAVLDWHLPEGRRRAAVWRAVLARIEPAPTVREVLDGALAGDLSAAGLDVCLQRPLAAGRAQLLLARRAVRRAEDGPEPCMACSPEPPDAPTATGRCDSSSTSAAPSPTPVRAHSPDDATSAARLPGPQLLPAAILWRARSRAELDEDGGRQRGWRCDVTWALQTRCKHSLPWRTDLTVPRHSEPQAEPRRTRSDTGVIAEPRRKHLRALSRLGALAAQPR